MPSFALISQILDALGAEVVAHTLLSTHLEQGIGHVSTDTRTIQPQDVFWR